MSQAVEVIDHEFKDETLELFREFHNAYGRWPLPSDRVLAPDLPSSDRVRTWAGGWQALWDELGAGKVPSGRAAGNYRKTGHLEMSKKAEIVVPVERKNPGVPLLGPQPADEPEPEEAPAEIEAESDALAELEAEEAEEMAGAGSFAAAAAAVEAAAAAYHAAKETYGIAVQRFEDHPFARAHGVILNTAPE